MEYQTEKIRIEIELLRFMKYWHNLNIVLSCILKLLKLNYYIVRMLVFLPNEHLDLGEGKATLSR